MRRIAIGILAVEGVLGLAWLALLATVPAAGRWFLPEHLDPALLRTLAVADIVFFAAAPLACAFGLARRARWAQPVLWAHAGGIVYAALWGWGLVVVTGAGWAGALLMTPGALVIPLLARALGREAGGGA